MSESLPQPESKETSPSTVRKLARRVLRQAGVHIPERSRSDLRPEITAEQKQLLDQGHGEVLVGSEEAHQLISALNSSPGHLGRYQYADIDNLPGQSELVATFVPDRDGLRQLDPKDERRGNLWTVPIATSKIVSGPGGFVDWRQGRPGPADKNGESSRSLIKRYAKLPPETAHAIDFVAAYVQPNGETYYTLSGNGSHTVGAAKLRGDEFVKARGDIVVYRLDGDYISESLTV